MGLLVATRGNRVTAFWASCEKGRSARAGGFRRRSGVMPIRALPLDRLFKLVAAMQSDNAAGQVTQLQVFKASVTQVRGELVL